MAAGESVVAGSLIDRIRSAFANWIILEITAMKWTLHILCLSSALVVGQVSAQPASEGFLCCNMRSDGSWISDINYAKPGMKIIPLGTPIKVTGYGRYRAYVLLDGGKQVIGNDYSRDLEMGSFVARYVLSTDPRLQMATFPERIRDAINNAQLTTGMTRQQVMMSVGVPVSSENPKLDANIWRFWREGDAEFQVVFDENGTVREIATDPFTRSLVVLP